jgi:hypothetical protein
VEIDPRWWNADMDLTVNVGQGTGSRDRDLVRLSQVLQSQLMLADRFMAAGAMDDAIDMLPKVIETLTRMGESAGLRDPAAYYPEYTDDKVMKLKALAAERAGKPSGDAERAKRDHEYRMAAASAQLTLDREAAAFKHDEKLREIDGDLGLKREQLNAEIALKRELGYAELGVDRELSIAGVAAKTSVNSASSGVHMGGEPG